jgi:hypothetical protein
MPPMPRRLGITGDTVRPIQQMHAAIDDVAEIKPGPDPRRAFDPNPVANRSMSYHLYCIIALRSSRRRKREVRAAHAPPEDRGVDHAQTLHALDAALVVDDRHRIVVASLARARACHTPTRFLDRLPALVVVHHVLEGESLDDEVVAM